jgi:hypothetical protein
VTISFGVYLVLWLFRLFCNVCVCVCMCRFCNVWVCVCVGFVMCGCVCVGFVMCAVAIVGNSWVVLFGEIVAVCCDNCRE